MIICQFKHIEHRCAERGYRIEDVLGCIVSHDGDNIVVDETHPDYPKQTELTRRLQEKAQKMIQFFRDNRKFFDQPLNHIAAQSDGLPVMRMSATPFTGDEGPGTELKKLLAKIGIHSSPTCPCNERARIMDAMEIKDPGWCEKNIETVVDWLQEEATKRNLPFSKLAAKMLIRRAIKNAKKKAATGNTATNG